MRSHYSIVIPLYNEEVNLPVLYQRLRSLMEAVPGQWEIVLIYDGSRDRTLECLRQLHQQDERICYLSFARNFGHQTAVTAGLNFARGDAVIVMDGDLQDPPELIPEMVKLWQQGYAVIYAQRTRRYQEGWFKRLTAYVFYRLLQQLADVEIPLDTGDFCLLDRQVVTVLNHMPERNRYVRGLRSWVGFRQIALPYERDPRYGGEIKYTFRKSLKLAITGLVSFSTVPLRISTYLGLFSAGLALVMAALVIYWRITSPESRLTGYAIIAAAVFFLGAVQLFSIGILGEYIGRIYEEVKQRPLYTLAEVAGFETVLPRTNGDKTPQHPA
ncbi:MAG TPA: glycosyltransferase family 2 protein [Leptolyngbyaceae cyanobacterium M33_DOE_097]|nr:glycosyltransferase family 2 protein [Leptolyngbyaceae cyanobacterium M33_DOE_097]